MVIDLVCYRRCGHNETDEPSYTQPLMYAKIKGHTSVGELYGEHLVRAGVITRARSSSALWAQKKAQMQEDGAGRLRALRSSRREPVELRRRWTPAAMCGPPARHARRR